MSSKVKNLVARTLRRFNEFTGSDNVTLVRYGFWGSAPFIFGSLVSLGLTIAYANLLSQDTYGTFKFIIALASSFGFLTLTGMNSAVIRAVARGEHGILRYSTWLQVKWNVVYTAAAMCIAAYYAAHHNTTIAIGIFILGLSFPLTTALNTFGAYLNGVRRFRTAAIINILSNVAYGACIMIGVVWFRTPVMLVLAYALGSLVPVVVAYFTVVRADVGMPTETGKREVTHFGKHYTAMNVLAVISRQIDRLSVFHVQGSIALALFAIAQAIPERLKGLMNSALPSILSNLSRRSHEMIRASFYRRIAQGMAIGFVVLACYWLAAPLLFRYILPKYLPSLIYSQWYSISIVFSLPILYIANVFQSQGMLRELYTQTVFGNLSRIIMLPLLMYFFGIWGLIYGTIAIIGASMLLGILLMEWHTRRTMT